MELLKGYCTVYICLNNQYKKCLKKNSSLELSVKHFGLYNITIKNLCISSSPASFLTAGTTATVALLRDGVELVVGSVGDSRAMLCRNGKANKLTTDHTPDCEDERHRYMVPTTTINVSPSG